MLTLAPKHRKTPKPFCRASIEPDGVLEIMMYDEIGDSLWSRGITAKGIKAQLDQAGDKCDKVLVCINSPGGDAFEGIAIYNVLKQSGKKIETRVDGLAASAASIIAMAGDEISMGENTLMMVHNAWGFCMGYADDMQKMAESLLKISEAIGTTYVSKTGKTPEEIHDMMDAETWMTAAEALEEGFCTRILEGADDVTTAALAMAKKFKSLRNMKHVPASLKAQKPEEPECACDCSNCTDGACNKCSDAGCKDENCEDCPMQTSRAKSKKNAHDVRLPGVAASIRLDSDGDCACTCEQCMAGDCDECSNPDCLDPDCEDCPMQAGLMDAICGKSTRPLSDNLREEVIDRMMVVNGPIPSHSTATSDASWDGPANEKRLKADQEASYYRKAYGWVDPDKDAKTKAAYKFIHHEVTGDGDVKAANIKACQAWIANLNGGRQKPDIPDGDRQGCWNHAARHLRDAGLEPAPLKSQAEIEEEEKKTDSASSDLSLHRRQLELRERRARTLA